VYFIPEQDTATFEKKKALYTTDLYGKNNNLHTVLSNTLLSSLTSYVEEITGDHQCRFRRNRSTTDHICIRQILEKTWEYNKTAIYI
jgi:hypothetical protein